MMKKIIAKSISHSRGTRDKKKVTSIVIHYTGNKGDTSENNGKYFADGNTRKAGAHFFVDRSGDIVKSIYLKYTAWSVGGSKYSDCTKTGGGKYYGVITNQNSVSIELCDIVDKYPSKKQIEGVKKVIKHIRKYCPNAKKVVRHFDVNGKQCPASMVNEKTWKRFLRDIGEI